MNHIDLKYYDSQQEESLKNVEQTKLIKHVSFCLLFLTYCLNLFQIWEKYIRCTINKNLLLLNRIFFKESFRLKTEHYIVY